METNALELTAAQLKHGHPGHSQLIDQLVTLLASCPPELIHIHDPYSPNLTHRVVCQLLEELKAISSQLAYEPRIVHINPLSCFHQRVLFDTILPSLGDTIPSWEDSCPCTTPDDCIASTKTARWNDSVDAFLRGVDTLSTHLSRRAGKDVRLLITVEKPERLKDKLSTFFQPLTNLRELVGVEIKPLSSTAI